MITLPMIIFIVAFWFAHQSYTEYKTKKYLEENGHKADQFIDRLLQNL